MSQPTYRPVTIVHGRVRATDDPNAQLYVYFQFKLQPRKPNDTLVACLYAGVMRNVRADDPNIIWPGQITIKETTLDMGELVRWKDFAPQCECGKDKHNFMRHSTWCPKYS